jgi:hypothetical protein
MYNEGISFAGDVRPGRQHELVNKRGAYFRYGETLLGQGRENAKAYLAENPAMLDELEYLIRNQPTPPCRFQALQDFTGGVTPDVGATLVVALDWAGRAPCLPPVPPVQVVCRRTPIIQRIADGFSNEVDSPPSLAIITPCLITN